MFGHAPFGAAAFGDTGGASLPIVVLGYLSAQPSELSAGVDLEVFASGDIDADVAAMSGAIVIPDAELGGSLVSEAEMMSGYVRRNMTTDVEWSGDATLDYVSTTTFIAMIEDGEPLLSYAAEIRLRSL